VVPIEAPTEPMEETAPPYSAAACALAKGPANRAMLNTIQEKPRRQPFFLSPEGEKRSVRHVASLVNHTAVLFCCILNTSPYPSRRRQ